MVELYENAGRRIADPEWNYQWKRFEDREQALFEAWIAPVTLDEFAGKEVLECGCGGGQHSAMIAAAGGRVTAVDLNTGDIMRQRVTNEPNIEFIEADIASLDIGQQFDIVICIGVIHHTDDPDRTFDAMYRHCRPGGRMIIWTYSAEGNGFVRYIIEPIRKALLKNLPRRLLVGIAWVLTILLYPVVYSIYQVPFLNFLPYFDYFAAFRSLSFQRNMLNVFDKLNAPQTRFTTRAKAESWFNSSAFDNASISIRHHLAVSYSLTGIKVDSGV